MFPNELKKHFQRGKSVRVLAIDPSGNFKNGKGTTGYFSDCTDCYLSLNGLSRYCGQIKAKDFNHKVDYYTEVCNIITSIKPDVLVIEGFRLSGNAMQRDALKGQDMETSELIGWVEAYIHIHHPDMEFVVQYNKDIKPRWNDEVLTELKLLKKENGRFYLEKKQLPDHARDAFKHFLQYQMYTRWKENE